MRKSGEFNGYCDKCKKSLCPEHAYIYVDGNNGVITNHSPYLCKTCYEKKYNKKILSDVDHFKESLISNLEYIKEKYNTDTVKLNKLIEYIKNF